MANRDNITVKNNRVNHNSSLNLPSSADESKVANSHFKKGDNITLSAIDKPAHDIVMDGQGLTTAELAIQTSTNKAAWNTWASKATIGDTRHHPQAGSWRLLGKAAPASGGPERWMWEPA
jgi:hypothetical protein